MLHLWKILIGKYIFLRLEFQFAHSNLCKRQYFETHSKLTQFKSLLTLVYQIEVLARLLFFKINSPCTVLFWFTRVFCLNFLSSNFLKTNFCAFEFVMFPKIGLLYIYYSCSTSCIIKVVPCQLQVADSNFQVNKVVDHYSL